MKTLLTICLLGSMMFGGCVPMAQQGTYGSTYSAGTSYETGVYLNGQLLTVEQKAQLDDLVGETLPQGRYWVDRDGNMGFEGQPARVNLVALANARGSSGSTTGGGSEQPGLITSRNSDGSTSTIVSDGKGCTILSTPSGSLTSGC